MKSASTIRAKFKRLNVNATNTSLWEEVNEEIKNKVKQQIQLVEGETKILFVLINSSYWWILTDQRLILNRRNLINYFNLRDIKKVEPKRLFEGEVSKQECSELDLYVNDQQIRLKLEESTWYAIYNILKSVTSK